MLIDGQVTVYIEDGNIFQLFTQPAITSIGCGTVVKDFMVPDFITPGTYKLHWVGVYKPNAFRTITIDTYSNDFQLK
jgi:hypothetical protein